MHFRNATLEEREDYYRNEFNPEKILEVMQFKPQLMSMDLGSESGIIKFPDKKGKIVMLPPNLSPEKLKEKMIHFLPEDVYYDRNIYTDVNAFIKAGKFKKFWEDENYEGQELCFDVDAENIREVDHNNHKDYTTLIKEAAAESLKVADVLKKKHGFSKFSFVYSGRGFHVKVNDEGSEKLTFKQRHDINDSLKGHPIDRWVSGGHSKLMRLPFSLHGLISRIVTPVNEKDMHNFNPNDEKLLPGFLK